MNIYGLIFLYTHANGGFQGAYMNEADRMDPNYEVNFYGTHFVSLSAIKLIYDPLSLLYCPTCVGKKTFCHANVCL